MKRIGRALIGSYEKLVISVDYVMSRPHLLLLYAAIVMLIALIVVALRSNVSGAGG